MSALILPLLSGSFCCRTNRIYKYESLATQDGKKKKRDPEKKESRAPGRYFGGKHEECGGEVFEL